MLDDFVREVELEVFLINTIAIAHNCDDYCPMEEYKQYEWVRKLENKTCFKCSWFEWAIQPALKLINLERTYCKIIRLCEENPDYHSGRREPFRVPTKEELEKIRENELKNTQEIEFNDCGRVIDA